jgi:predicted ABC-type ATPase
MLPQAFDGIVSFDRDSARVGFEVELELQGVPKNDLVARATRMMEDKLKERMAEAINSHSHFVLETPLSHPDYWRYIDMFDNAGYQIQLNYLCLDKVSDCIGRVEQRVLEGGHYVRPDTIKGVYNNNLIHINTEYQTFDRIELYDGMIVPALLCSMEKSNVEYLSPKALKKNWIKKGMPLLAAELSKFK